MGNSNKKHYDDDDIYHEKQSNNMNNMHKMPLTSSAYNFGNYELNEPTQITPYLFLGGNYGNKNPQVLKQLGITHVLNMAVELQPHYEFVNNNRQFRVKHIQADDTIHYNLRYHFEEAFDFIDEAIKLNSKVLVHCMMGISRSATIVVAYLMSRHKMPLNTAYMFVKKKRPIISPNPTFMRILEQFEYELYRGISNQQQQQAHYQQQPPQQQQQTQQQQQPQQKANQNMMNFQTSPYLYRSNRLKGTNNNSYGDENVRKNVYLLKNFQANDFKQQKAESSATRIPIKVAQDKMQYNSSSNNINKNYRSNDLKHQNQINYKSKENSEHRALNKNPLNPYILVDNKIKVIADDRPRVNFRNSYRNSLNANDSLNKSM